MNSITRIMIIIWRWDRFTNVSEAPPNKAYQIVNVQKESENSTEAILVQVLEDKLDDQVIKNLCTELGARTCATSTDIFWFVHRSAKAERFINFITDPAVMNLKNNQSKYFLFSGGSDQIYFETNFFGLLTARGAHYFFKGTIYERDVDTLVKDQNSNQQLINSYYFNKTWDYYEIEIEKKPYALMIDLLSHFMSIDIPTKNETSYPNSYWQEELAKDESLKLRVDNFIKMYKVRVSNTIGMSEEDHDLLHDYEKKEETSFDFDDVSVNFLQKPTTREAYKKLAIKFEGVFLGPDSYHEKDFTVTTIKELFLNMMNNVSSAT